MKINNFLLEHLMTEKYSAPGEAPSGALYFSVIRCSRKNCLFSLNISPTYSIHVFPC